MKRVIVLSVLCGSAAMAQDATETMYAIDDPIFPILYTLNKDTGQVLTNVLVSGQEAIFGGLAVDDAGDLYSIDGYNDGDSDRLFRIDRMTGDGTVVGDTGFNWNFRNVTVDPTTDILYGSRDNELYTLDRSTGEAKIVAPITGDTLDQLTTFAIDSNGNAYGTDIGGAGLFQIDLATGNATHIGDLGGSGFFNDLAFDSGDVLYGARGNGQVYTIDVDEASAAVKFQGVYVGIAFLSEGCEADCNGDGELNVLDFVCFQSQWVAQSRQGDCDGNGEFNVIDFVCFQGLFVEGCN